MKEKYKIESKDNLELKSTSRRIGKLVIEVEDIQIRSSNNQNSSILIENFNYSFSQKDRVGIIGPNGCGKSTLLNIIAGKEKPVLGNIRLGETLKIGYLDQQTNELAKGKGLERKVIDYIEETAKIINIGEKKLTASKLLENFLFKPSQQHGYISKLSGGEKRRLSLCKILIQSPNVLILDEPTNDLDIETLSILENFLESFLGCVVVVSHDRYFLDRVVNRIFFINERKVSRFEGNYSDFIEKNKNKYNFINQIKQKDCSNKRKVDKKNISGQNILSEKKSSRKRTFKENRELQEINNILPLLEEKKKITENKISSRDGDLNILSNELADIILKINAYEERWLELSEID